MMAIWLQPKIMEQQAQDVLYCAGGIVTECPRANFYLVTDDNRVLTPAQDILKGIIRKQLLKMNGKFKIEESSISIEDIYKARGAFITSTTKNILPVTQVNDKIIGNGLPDDTTLALSAELEKTIQHHLQQPSVQYA